MQHSDNGGYQLTQCTGKLLGAGAGDGLVGEVLATDLSSNP